MNALSGYFHFPLLAKELTERAARWQTYVVRAAYGVLFFSVFLWSTREYFGVIGLGGLGGGARILSLLFSLQMLGICLLVPAQMCGAVAREKETGSLPLLLLTPLGPWRIILQKYFAGLVPMLSCLLLGVPLFAIAYAFGGFGPGTVAWMGAFLVLTVSAVGAFALLCSTWCRTSVRAFVATYVVGALLVAMMNWMTYWLVVWLNNAGVTSWNIYGRKFFVTQWCAYGAVLTLASLVLARMTLQRAAFRPARARRPRRTWALARVLRALNARLGGVIFGRSSELPEDRPIAWREGRRFGLHNGAGTFRLGAWIAAFASAAYVILEAVGVYLLPYRDVDWFARVSFFLTGLAALTMMPCAAGAFASEHAGETLAVLLTTPLGARAIVTQKAQFPTRIQYAFVPALALFFIGQAALYAWNRKGGPADDSTLMWLGTALPALVVYPQVIVWSGLWIGLVCRTARTALLISLGALAGFFFLPGWLAETTYSLIAPDFNPHWSNSDLWSVFVHALSPLEFQAARLKHGLYMELGGLWMLTVAAHYAFFTVLALAFRGLCLIRADRLLRRHA